MKKFLLVVFVLSFITGAGGGLQAGETDALIKKLIDKGIITKEEAAEIQKEEQKAEEKSQEKIVKEIQDKGLAVPEALKGVKVGILGYVDFSYGDSPEFDHGESDLNKFRLTRGYLTVEKEILPWFGARVTLDTYQDTEDTDESYKMRLKYYYAQFKAPNLGFLTGMKSEVGMGHMPWLDFEENINPYRCQGTMAIERAGVFNSSDLGVSLMGDLGGRIKDSRLIIGDDHYDGRYGTWHLGVYNGSGYHESEDNNNKVIEGRLSLRPVPDIIPGLQLSYFGLRGDGNDDSTGEWPEYNVNLGMLSYQNPWVIFTGQCFTSEGNAKGKWVDALGHALDTKGYSAFGNVKLPVLDKKIALFARYDHFDQDDDGLIAGDADYDMYMGGIAYDIYKGNMILLTYETTDYGRDAGKKGSVPDVTKTNLGDDKRIQAVLQVKY
ncbi:conserved exported hypothetical protein [uncultured Desulfobacterium sp.]|uniref:Phosphate-selective porin O and P n=1 Tax=uncultured Desulfobacterium sp. TaxID=201089 RepID=A0A445MUA3_9BACT|nr:conserved exported hypothetical protein [uncultured Desulfobacterium sp.]